LDQKGYDCLDAMSVQIIILGAWPTDAKDEKLNKKLEEHCLLLPHVKPTDGVVQSLARNVGDGDVLVREIPLLLGEFSHDPRRKVHTAFAAPISIVWHVAIEHRDKQCEWVVNLLWRRTYRFRQERLARWWVSTPSMW
jgi:hypothetical protein